MVAKEAAIPAEQPEGQPIVASAKTLFSTTNAKLPHQRRGPDVPLITAELTNTIATYKSTRHSQCQPCCHHHMMNGEQNKGRQDKGELHTATKTTPGTLKLPPTPA